MAKLAAELEFAVHYRNQMTMVALIRKKQKTSQSDVSRDKDCGASKHLDSPAD